MPTFGAKLVLVRIDADTTQGRFLIRAKFMDSNGASLGYSDITAMYPGAISSWTRVGGRVTAPANSVSMQVQYLLYMSSGWVNIDDVEVTIVPPNAATEVTKYYYFSGQRIAMRKNGVLTYLHGDHLGSTVLETNITGTVTSDEKYLAYGKQRDSGKVVTDHRFTGQKEDASGLQYFNSRFYDPVIGMFVSPDTIVPQPGAAVSYNRYAYANLNPLNSIDPSGHCPGDAKAMQEAGNAGVTCWWIYNDLIARGFQGLDWRWDYTLTSITGFLEDHPLLGHSNSLDYYGDVVGYSLVTSVGMAVQANGQAMYQLYFDEYQAYESDNVHSMISIGYNVSVPDIPVDARGRIDKLVFVNNVTELGLAEFIKKTDSFVSGRMDLYSRKQLLDITSTSVSFASLFKALGGIIQGGSSVFDTVDTANDTYGLAQNLTSVGGNERSMSEEIEDLSVRFENAGN